MSIAQIARNEEALVTAASAVLASFRNELDTGTLRPPQHASLLLLEVGLAPFVGDSGAPAPGGIAGERPPGSDIGLSGPATAANDQSAAA